MEHSAKKVKRKILVNVLFHAIPKSEYNYVNYRHGLESAIFREINSEYDTIYLKHYESGYTPIPNGDDVYFFKGTNGFFFLPVRMCLFLRSLKPDVVFLHSFIFPVQLLFMKLFLPGNTKILVQHHAEKPFRHWVKRRLQKWAYSGADAYLFASFGLSDSFVERKVIKFSERIHEVMESSCAFTVKDRSGARRDLGMTGEAVFLWVGRLNENKDPQCVLNAFREYKSRGYKFSLYMIYGSCELETGVLNFIRTNEMDAEVTLLGKVEHSELEKWFSASDYFVAASHYEGSGIALCEAMACGCVPIVTKIPSFITMTGNGKEGYLFEPGNAADLLNVLLELKNTNYEDVRRRVVHRFQTDLSFPAIGRKILTIIQTLK